MTFHVAMNVALAFVREGGEWKLVREGLLRAAVAEAIAGTRGECAHRV